MMGAEDEARLRQITNFGGNQSWYSQFYRPASETEILEILARHPGVTIRAVGSGHSWSAVAAQSDIVLDMSALNSVTLIKGDEELVRAGAGCRIQDLLDRLHAETGRTLPTLGAIKKQTISGAISTATHGSGRQSLSHFVAALRMVVFDASGHPVIREFTEGPELLAARCGLGCAGIILSVDLHTVPKYMVMETLRLYHSIEQVMAAYAEHPLSHFGYWPYGWKLTVFERKPIEHRALTVAEKANALFFRLFNLVCADFLFNLFVVISRWVGPRMIKAMQKFTPYTFAPIKDRERIDDAEHVLTSHHYLFRHEEMEMFVAESDLARALGFVRASVESFAGVDAVFPAEFLAAINQLGLDRELAARRGSYTHHYPLFCRRIPPDETLISMTAFATEPMFSISIFTYDPPCRRDAYYAFCSFLAHALRNLFNARLHWGKHFPFDHRDIAPLYPRLEEFRALCHSHDPNGVLRNGYTGRVLNLPPGPKAAG